MNLVALVHDVKPLLGDLLSFD